MPASLPPVLSPIELAQLLRDRPDARLLDVRTPSEFETEHIAGAYNVPLDTLGEHGAAIRARVAEPVVLVCRSGQRARKAEEALKTAGMTHLHVLDGGMSGWAGAGLPVRRGQPRMSLERQVRIAAGTLAATGGFLALFVDPLFAAVPAFVGSGLVFAGVTDTCAMGMLIAKLPYNRPASCDVPAMVRALATGAAPTSSRSPRGVAAVDTSCATQRTGGMIAGVPMREAVGTSLLVIAMNSAAGFAGYLGSVDVDWRFLTAFTLAAVSGAVVGMSVAHTVPPGAASRT